MSKTKYEWRFDYDGGIEENGHFISSEPHIYIVDEDGDDLLEVFLEPKAKVEFPDCEDKDWELPNFVVQLLAMMNRNVKELNKEA